MDGYPQVLFCFGVQDEKWVGSLDNKGWGSDVKGQPYYLLLVEMSCFIAYSHIISIPIMKSCCNVQF